MKSMPETRSRRIDSVQCPIIPTIGEKISNTPGTISLGQGVVYYGPPEQALNRISAFLENPDHHKYGAVQGLPELRAALAEKLGRENRIDLERSEVVVTAGSNMGFYHAVLAIGDPGDEFIITDPYYFNHEMAIRMAGCRPVAAVIPGSAFGIREGCHLRIAYGALDRHSAQVGAGRLVEGIRGLISAA
jgi:aspartate/methionine/tyrosine aminotransferase